MPFAFGDANKREDFVVQIDQSHEAVARQVANPMRA